MSSVFPTLATVRKYHDENTALSAVCEIIAQAAALLSIGRGIQRHQIEFLAEDILRQYYFLTIAEIRLCMEYGVRGDYGTIYDRLDTSVVAEWIEKYITMRAEISARKAEQKPGDEVAYWREQAKKNPELKPMPDEIKKALLNVENKWLVDGELKAGVKSGDFEPDAAVLEMIEQEWGQDKRPDKIPYKDYEVLRIAQIKAQMKK